MSQFVTTFCIALESRVVCPVSADVTYGRPLAPLPPCGQVEPPLSEQGAPLPLPERDETVVVGVEERELPPALHVLLDPLAMGVRNGSMVGVPPLYNNLVAGLLI